MATIILSLSNNVLFIVATEKTVKGLWDCLSDMHEMAFASNKVFLINKLYNLKMKEGGNVKSFE